MSTLFHCVCKGYYRYSIPQKQKSIYLHLTFRKHVNTLIRDKLAAILQPTFSNASSWMKMNEFRLRFHWSSFVRVHWKKFQHFTTSVVVNVPFYIIKYFVILELILVSPKLNAASNFFNSCFEIPDRALNIAFKTSKYELIAQWQTFIFKEALTLRSSQCLRVSIKVELIWINMNLSWILMQRNFLLCWLVLCKIVTSDFPRTKSMSDLIWNYPEYKCNLEIVYDLRLNKRLSKQTGYIRRHCAHCDVTVMCWRILKDNGFTAWCHFALNKTVMCFQHDRFIFFKFTFFFSN